MIRALKVTMIAYAAVGILFGLALIFIPHQLDVMFGLEQGPAWVTAVMAMLGVCFLLFCYFLIIASRDPLRNILWVKYAIAFATLMLVINAYSLIIGNSGVKQALTDIIIHAVFAVAFLAFYPWHAPQESK